MAQPEREDGMTGSDAASTPAPAPRPVGPYNALVRAGGWLICSGQVGLRDGSLVGGGVAAQVTQAIANIETLLSGEGSGLAAVAKTTVFLAHIDDYPAMNDAYTAAFGPHRPARSAFAVAALPLGALVEIEAWAYVG
jgi:2-iminobutanoate/2-iminopropanoate deaminase